MSQDLEAMAREWLRECEQPCGCCFAPNDPEADLTALLRRVEDAALERAAGECEWLAKAQRAYQARRSAHEEAARRIRALKGKP